MPLASCIISETSKDPSSESSLVFLAYGVYSFFISFSINNGKKKNEFYAIFCTVSYVQILKQGASLKHATEIDSNNKVMKFPSTFYIANESSLHSFLEKGLLK